MSRPGGGTEPRGWLFSLAPTVRQFLAVAGVPIESGSTTPLPLTSLPSLPAENRISMSGLFHTNLSTVRAAAL
jgi:hypothetical protein